MHVDTVYLAYLPLAHIMELAVEVTCFAVGCRVGYGSPGTITPTALKMKQTDPPQVRVRVRVRVMVRVGVTVRVRVRVRVRVS